MPYKSSKDGYLFCPEHDVKLYRTESAVYPTILSGTDRYKNGIGGK
jgi:hypothetical protein